MKALTSQLAVLLQSAPGASKELQEFIESAFLLGVVVALEQKGHDKVEAALYAQERFSELMIPAEGRH